MKPMLSFAVCLLCTHLLQAQPAIADDWKVAPKQAARMMQYYRGCSGDCFVSKATPDTAKEAAIRAAYPNAKSFSWENARYTSEDVARYASRNARRLKAGGAQVTGYSTLILKVVDEDDSVYYFDIASICPPPSLCNSEEKD